MQTRSALLVTAACIAVLAILVNVALQSGLARQAFFEVFARVKGVDVLAPTVIREPPVDSPYQRWLKAARTRLPVHEAMSIENVYSIALEPWPAMGDDITGLYLRFADYQMSDGRLISIPVGGNTASERHFYEKGVYFLGGPGHTMLYGQGSEPLRVDWREGSLLSIPLNVRHQHFNDADVPVRILAITSFPFVLNAVNSEAFIEDSDFSFTDRFDGDEAFLSVRERVGEHKMRRNFIDDVLRAPTVKWELLARGHSVKRWDMAGNSMLSLHTSELPPRTLKKAHRHTSDAFILLLSGSGYSVTWPEGAYHKRQRIDWQKGTLFVPPTYWYHQHLNTGDLPARYLAINVPELVINLGLRFADDLNVNHPEIEAEWEREMAMKAAARTAVEQ